ncbi:hypothetical protein [Pandoraea apista]|uniref:hypothetical protein n=1 Tax=Pandoraea apista TaxID=93218 RepID=UPI00058AAA4E|nr:hypothetical protein [Pandoraea apista]AJF00308.1 hypothetical protein SG18_22875 [Pandoraea apista]AKH74476.1 hypothetical protein XM39_23055 [Pandoraea apista]AKI63026.1 hypothetical protein AA956_16380 [Pandoraea apista]AVF41279.1 hypothetical protein AL486_17420 [Pandoraea apista]OXS97857.1 hypothetical protein B7H01_00745 [Pandoraea apista]
MAMGFAQASWPVRAREARAMRKTMHEFDASVGRLRTLSAVDESMQRQTDVPNVPFRMCEHIHQSLNCGQGVRKTGSPREVAVAVRPSGVDAIDALPLRHGDRQRQSVTTAGYRANASPDIADACVLLEQLPTENSVVIGKQTV